MWAAVAQHRIADQKALGLYIIIVILWRHDLIEQFFFLLCRLMRDGFLHQAVNYSSQTRGDPQRKPPA